MSATFSSRRAFLRRLVPARIRQQGWLIAQSLVAIALVLALLRTAQIRPIVFSEQALQQPALAKNVSGRVDLFDRSVPHDIAIELSEVEYQKLKRDFAEKGEKTWIRADVTIDGTRLESVGIRLKGNSTLMSLRRGGGRPPGMPGMPGMPGAGSNAPPFPTFGGVLPASSGLLPAFGGPAPASSGGPPAPSASGASGGLPGGMATVSFDDPSTLPLVLGFDHFVKGRGYQGRSELAVRPVVGTSGAALNEAVALQLIADSGQSSQRFTWVRFRLNGAVARTRLVLENPDQSYAASLGRGEGALFKSKSTNTFTYKGEDVTAYTTDFAQLSAQGSRDLAPVISLLRFVDTSSDAKLDAEIARWIDVEEFAAYVATHDLLGNFDDMAGPGRNFLLWYDASDRRSHVITWDMNLAISSSPMGGAGLPPMTPGGAMSGKPALGQRLPSGPGRGGPGGPGGPGMGNKLKQRFVASAALAPTRDAARKRLVTLWFESGLAERRARELATSIPTTSALTQEAIDKETDAVVARLRALAATAAAPASSTPQMLGSPP